MIKTTFTNTAGRSFAVEGDNLEEILAAIKGFILLERELEAPADQRVRVDPVLSEKEPLTCGQERARGHGPDGRAPKPNPPTARPRKLTNTDGRTRRTPEGLRRTCIVCQEDKPVEGFEIYGDPNVGRHKRTCKLCLTLPGR